jgi:hypothetical protein
MTKQLLIIKIFIIIPTFFAFSSTRALAENDIHNRSNNFVQCDIVDLSLGAIINILPPIGPGTGLAKFKIGGQLHPATLIVGTLAPPELQPDGRRTFIATLEYDFGEGNVLYAYSQGQLIETGKLGVFKNTNIINYAGGTGIYKNAFGRFEAIGDQSFPDYLIDMRGQGEVCNVGSIKSEKQ